MLIFEFLADNSSWVNQSGNPFSVFAAEVSTNWNPADHFCQKTIFSKDSSINNIYKSFQNNSVCISDLQFHKMQDSM